MLLAWNTLGEAAASLSKETNKDWTEREVIQACLNYGVMPHIQILTDRTDVWPWMREGEMAEIAVHPDIMSFLGGTGVVRAAIHNGLIYTLTPGMRAEMEEIRLSKARLHELIGIAKNQKYDSDSKSPQKMEGTDEVAPLENWMMKVQVEATKRWQEQRKVGCNPTRHSLKDELAKWCRDNDIFTTYGINPTPDYIYRHVISKRRWAHPETD